MTNLQDFRNKEENKITIYCFSSNTEITFDAFITAYTDQVTPTWNNQTVYSRMDPLSTYKGTTRKINIAFDVPSGNIDEARDNYYKIVDFMDSMYPYFSEGDNTNVSTAVGAAIVSGVPLFRIKFANYIDNLLGIIRDLDYKPDFSAGLFMESDNTETDVYSAIYKLNLSIDILHEIPEQTEGLQDFGRYITSKERYRMNSQVAQQQRLAAWESAPQELKDILIARKLDKEIQELEDELEELDKENMKTYQELLEEDKKYGTNYAAQFAKELGLQIPVPESKDKSKSKKKGEKGTDKKGDSKGGSKAGKGAVGRNTNGKVEPPKGSRKGK